MVAGSAMTSKAARSLNSSQKGMDMLKPKTQDTQQKDSKEP